MAQVTKKSKEWTSIDRENRYEAKEALGFVKKFATAKFDERVDVSIRLGVDPRKGDQMLRSSVVLPQGTGQTLKVLVFCTADKEKEALDAGADYAGGQELADKVLKENWYDFDRVVATPDMMAVVGKIGRQLGPRGLMPNPKVGTVTTNVSETVAQIKKGQVQFKTDKGANVQCTIGLSSFTEDQLFENLQAIYDTLLKLKPASAKGQYVKNISVSSTMGPGVKVDLNQFK